MDPSIMNTRGVHVLYLSRPRVLIRTAKAGRSSARSRGVPSVRDGREVEINWEFDTIMERQPPKIIRRDWYGGTAEYPRKSSGWGATSFEITGLLRGGFGTCRG